MIFIFIFTILAWFSLTQQFDAFHEVLVTEVVVYLGSNYFYLWIVWTDKSSVPQPQHCTKFLAFLMGTSRVQISLPQLSNFLKKNKKLNDSLNTLKINQVMPLNHSAGNMGRKIKKPFK